MTPRHYVFGTASFALALASVSVTTVVTIAVTAMVPAPAAHAQPPAPQAQVAPLLTKPLAGIEGKEALVLTVEYPPGVASAPHRHNANTFVYVLEGSVVMQVAGGKEMTLGVGDTFYESPSDIHSVSRNASDSKPAKILVVLVKDAGAPPTVPATEGVGR